MKHARLPHIATWWLLLVLFCSGVHAQTIHVVSIADTLDRTIGKGTGANARKLADFVTEVGSALELPVQKTVISDASFSCQNINDSINNISPGPNDIVFIYYSGHGFRLSDDNSIFPSFYCGSEIYSGTSPPSLIKLATTLEQKRPRLAIVIADTCNIVLTPPPTPTPAYSLAPPPNRKLAYEKLFLKYKGVILISSSTAGQFSWYLEEGGLFSSQLFRAISNITLQGTSGTWQQIINQATMQISVAPGIVQNPISDLTKLAEVQ